MTTWFDLPPEVKQIIFSMVSDAESIIYVPRDRRRKVDTKYLEAHHFHDLLLVSKTFITPDEFAFAVLSSAKLTFYSYNELRRLITEVPPSFKESIRSIHLSRTHLQDTPRGPCTDAFNGFSTIENILSTHMPQLRRIYVSWPDYCAQVALCQMPHTSFDEALDLVAPSLIEDVLSEKPEQEVTRGRFMHKNSLCHVAASFLGDRSTGSSSKNWTRPSAWIRRLMSCAESKNIEVVLQMEICIAFLHRLPVYLMHANHRISMSGCWSTKTWNAPSAAFWQTHLEAEMSSRDYMLKVEHDGRKFAYHQKLAYDLLHSPSRRGMNYWLDMVKEVKPRLAVRGHALSHGDGF